MRRLLQVPLTLAVLCLFAPACQDDVPAPASLDDVSGSFIESCCVAVVIDIKPGSYPNAINSRSKGAISVAILGSAAFDVRDVDVTTLAFGPGEAIPTHPVRTDSDHYRDANSDGFGDLVTHYRQQEAGLAPGDTEACLRGGLVDGSVFEGCDEVVVK